MTHPEALQDPPGHPKSAQDHPQAPPPAEPPRHPKIGPFGAGLGDNLGTILGKVGRPSRPLPLLSTARKELHGGGGVALPAGVLDKVRTYLFDPKHLRWTPGGVVHVGISLTLCLENFVNLAALHRVVLEVPQ